MASNALEKGQQFLKENATKEGVQASASGLQHKVLREGTGKQPKVTDTVEVHYEGRLIDGTVFDSSYQRGETIEFPLDGVIAGWTEGVALMKEGAKYQLYIPSELAYGSYGAGSDIGPDETLIFDVELIKVR
jgi:FKBP-type peptidyl-prolyl cis-trans isomerase